MVARPFDTRHKRIKDTRRTEGLLLQREEDGVNELDVFKCVVDDIIELKPLRDIRISY